MDALVSRLEVVTKKLEQVAQSGLPSSSYGISSQASVPAINDVTNGSLDAFMTASQKIGGEVATQAEIVKGAFEAQTAFLNIVARCKKPSNDKTLNELVMPISHKITDIQTFKEQNRRSSYINHLSAIAESIPALGWVLVSPTPGPHVKEMAESGQFYTNRVLKEFKEKDVTHVEWVKAWTEVLNALHSYVKQHHTTGVTWNNNGQEASSSIGAAPPPPPVLPPPPPPAAPAGTCAPPSDGRAQLFADLNKGADITKSLKKVTDDQKTHKNPALRASAPASVNKKPQVPVKTVGKAASAAPKKPPKIELEGKKWIVEYHQNNHQIVLNDTIMKQTVYIYNCQNCTIVVKGKINAITIDSCKKTALVFDECISSVDFVNCQSVKAQVTVKVPIVNIDKTDGCMLYLSKDSMHTQIVTAKSSEMNVLLPDSSNEFKELPIPEQFKTYWDGKKLVTEVTDISLG